MPWALTPRGTQCPQAKKTPGTVRPLERGVQSPLGFKTMPSVVIQAWMRRTRGGWTLCLLQDGGGGIGQHLAPQDNIRGVRILSEVVADASDTWDE
jgi:hypothetical protein